MDADDLRLFARVARLGSFAAVARDESLEASSVSRTIAALEGELGLRLFQRSTRRMTLTEAGARYLVRVEAILEDLDSARHEALALSSAASGTLRLTASIAFGTAVIVPLLAEFRQTYPNVHLDLVFTDANLDLIAERIDLAVRLTPAVRADVIATKLIDVRYRVCATPAYLARSPALRVPKDLDAHDCLVINIAQFRREWQFRSNTGVVDRVPVRSTLAALSAFAIYVAAKHGLGPALLPSWLIADDFRTGLLVDVFPDHEVQGHEMPQAAWLLYPSRSHLPSKVRVMINFLKASVPQRCSR